MLSLIARRRLDAFERTHGYDLSYARRILKLSPRALWLYTRATQLGHFRQGVPADVHAAVQITALLQEDCGPCVQLAVRLARSQGVPAATLRALVSGRADELPPDCLLGVRFARAVLARHPEADELRERLTQTYGPLAIVTLAFALAAARIYPTVKYALGYGHACTRVVVDDVPVTLRPTGPHEGMTPTPS